MSGKVILRKRERHSRLPRINEIIVTCPGGAEETLANELLALGYSNPRIDNGAVRVESDIQGVFDANALVRTGSRVLVPLEPLTVSSYDRLYDTVYAIPWETLIEPRNTFRIDATTRSSTLRDHRFVAMRTKDAIVDRQRERFSGKRSSIDKNEPNVIVNVFVGASSGEVSIDSSGAPLHERGYRLEAGAAPLRETVAAMLVLEMHHAWNERAQNTDGTGVPLRVVDPFCGSGTLLIEAALFYTQRGPGTLGRGFAWNRWPWLEEGSRSGARRRASAPGSASQIPAFVGIDRDRSVIEKARRNAARAGVSHLVDFEEGDFRRRLPSLLHATGGYMLANPPYGERMQPEDLRSVYTDFGAILREEAGGWIVGVLTTDRTLSGLLRLRPDSTKTVFNGAIPCSFTRYTIFTRP